MTIAITADGTPFNLATLDATGKIPVSQLPALPTPPGGGSSLKSVLDFGAVGNGSADDGPAFSAALAWAALNGHIVVIPALTYAIKTPIVWTSQGNVTTLWGLSGLGATLVSHVTGDVMTLSSNHVVRYLRLSGFSIEGNGSDAHGLHLFCPNGSSFLSNGFLDSITVEGMGQNGLFFEGNVFEMSVMNCAFQNNLNGATFAHTTTGGVCSAISIINSFFNANRNYGMQATIIGATYGGTTDVRIYGGYCRENHSYGFYYNNGSGVGAIVNVGFENNCTGLKPGDPNGAHVFSQGPISLKYSSGYNETGGATYLLRGYFTGLVTLDECAQFAGAAMAATGPAKIVQVYGPNTGAVIMRSSIGELDVASGNSAIWVAKNCLGGSPAGAMTYSNTLNG